MQIVELNPPGNFDPWNPAKLKELKKIETLIPLQHGLLFDNSTIRFWEIRLKPQERIPFHKRAQRYSMTCLTNGLAISRNEDGSIRMFRFKEGEANYWDLGIDGTIADLENIGEDELVLHIIEYLPQTDNVPQNLLAS